MGDMTSKCARFVGSPFLLALLVSLLLFLVGHPQYETNDDLAMIGILSGEMGLQPTPDAIFLSLPLSRLLYTLYSLSGSIPWYGILLYFFLFVSFYLGIKTISFFSFRSVTKALLVLVLGFLYAFIFYRFNFAAVALFMWFTALSYLGTLNLYGQLQVRTALLMGAFTGAAYMVRPDIAYIAVIVASPMLATFLIPAARRRILYLVAPLAVIVFTSLATGYLYHNDDEFRRYERFNHIRSEFTDTARSYANAATPGALARAQWNPEDYLLGKRWWFHDERIYSSDRIERFLAANSATRRFVVSVDSIVDSYTRFWPVLLMLGICFLALALESPGQEPSSDSKTVPVKALCTLFLVVSLVAVTALAGIRFPPRVAMPVFALFLLLAVVLRPLIEKSLTQRNTVKRLFYAGAFSLVIYFSCSIWLDLEQMHVRMAEHKARNERSFQLALRANGPETIFTYADAAHFFSAEAVSPFLEYRAMQRLATFPMGWLIGSPAYNSFLKRHGFGDRKTAVPAMVDNPRVLFCFYQHRTGSLNSYSSQLLRQFERNYGHFFPGRQFRLAAVADFRGQSTGWIFFRVVTVPASLAATTATPSP